MSAVVRPFQECILSNPLQFPSQSSAPLTTITANRRRFIVILPLAGAALLAACSKPGTPVAALPAAIPPIDAPASMPAASPMAAPAPEVAPLQAPAPAPMPQTPAKATGASVTVALEETDPLAKTLGYVGDSTRADAARFPTKGAGSHCATCAVYQGAAGSAQAACPIFGGKTVSANGWCSAWVKKV